MYPKSFDLLTVVNDQQVEDGHGCMNKFYLSLCAKNYPFWEFFAATSFLRLYEST